MDTLISLPNPDLAYTRLKLISPFSTNRSLCCGPFKSHGLQTTAFSHFLSSKTGTMSWVPSDSLQVHASINLGVGIRAGSHRFDKTAIRRGSRSSPGIVAVKIAQIYKRGFNIHILSSIGRYVRINQQVNHNYIYN